MTKDSFDMVDTEFFEWLESWQASSLAKRTGLTFLFSLFCVWFVVEMLVKKIWRLVRQR